MENGFNVASWKEIPVSVPRPRRRLGRLALAGLLVLLVGVGIGAALQLSLSELFGVQPQLWVPENTCQSLTKIAAVDSQGNGVLADLQVEISPGRGVYYSIQPMIELDLQSSANTAVQVASEVTGKALDAVRVSFTITASAEIVGGPSAGAAMAVITIATVENCAVRGDAVITGIIQADGGIGLVGGIYAKAKAANDEGMALFLVPDGQYVEVSEQVGPSTVVRYKPISYLQQYAQQQGWGLQIQEVSTIEEAADLMLEAG